MTEIVVAKILTPEEEFELLRSLLGRGAEVRTFYRHRRVAALEKAPERRIVIRYEDGCADKMRVSVFAKRRFVVMI
jgi:hypothetical protein